MRSKVIWVHFFFFELLLQLTRQSLNFPFKVPYDSGGLDAIFHGGGCGNLVDCSSDFGASDVGWMPLVDLGESLGGRPGDISRVSCQKGPICHALPGQPPEALTAENDCFQRSVVASGPVYLPVLIKISADKRPLNQLTVKNLFFLLIIKTFCH